MWLLCTVVCFGASNQSKNIEIKSVKHSTENWSICSCLQEGRKSMVFKIHWSDVVYFSLQMQFCRWRTNAWRLLSLFDPFCLFVSRTEGKQSNKAVASLLDMIHMIWFDSNIQSLSKIHYCFFVSLCLHHIKLFQIKWYHIHISYIQVQSKKLEIWNMIRCIVLESIANVLWSIIAWLLSDLDCQPPLWLGLMASRVRRGTKREREPEQEDVGSNTLSFCKEKRNEVPSEDERSKFDLPSTYKIKYCKLCDNSSLSICEYVDHGSAWGLLLPWGNGTRTAPSGAFCRSGVFNIWNLFELFGFVLFPAL